MKRSTLLLCWSVAWAAAVLAPAPSFAAGGEDSLQYDQSAAGRRFNMLRIYLKTRVCMVDGTKAMLRLGSRSRSQVEKFTLAVCGNPLRVELVTTGGFTDAEAALMLHSLATASLDDVLSQ